MIETEVQNELQRYPELPFHLGHAIRFYRHRMGISQSELARRAGLERSTLAYLEKGKTRRPALEKVWAIAGCLKVSFADLVSRTVILSDQKAVRSNGQADFIIACPEGNFRICSWTWGMSDIFVGQIMVPPRAEIEREKIPRAAFIFYKVTTGLLLFQYGGEEHLLREEQHIVFPLAVQYSLYNPQHRESRAILVSMPSFLSAQAE
jgi:transcriptional regulator with XRE-family HTH domain